MKSYYKFLETVGRTAAVDAVQAPPRVKKPVHRSSAVFPVIEDSVCHTRIMIFGYWMIKRDLAEIGMLLTLRAGDGRVLHRRNLALRHPAVINLEIGEMLRTAGIQAPDGFVGSLEVEVFSTRDLVFTYPAIVLCYHGEGFSSAVHTTGRIFNDLEDLEENSEEQVREAGFDIYAKDGHRPFIAFVNGPFSDDRPVLEFEVINHRGASFRFEAGVDRLAPYQTCFIDLAEHAPLEQWLEGRVGTVLLKHSFKGFFPRLTCGNRDKDGGVADLTHTYYDCSSNASPSDYWPSKPGLHDASILVPLFGGDSYTDLVFYPVYSPSEFWLSLVFYDAEGTSLAELPKYKKFKTDLPVFDRCSFAEAASAAGCAADPSLASVQLILEAAPGKQLPTRVKMGLNVGTRGRSAALPCNICFAPKVGDPDAGKTRSFHWSPVLNIGRSVVTVTNSCSQKDYRDTAEVRMRFYREADDAVLERAVRIAAHGILNVDTARDAELAAFLGGAGGWAVFDSTNPHVYGWYFDFHPSGTVAGDHCF